MPCSRDAERESRSAYTGHPYPPVEHTNSSRHATRDELTTSPAPHGSAQTLSAASAQMQITSAKRDGRTPQHLSAFARHRGLATEAARSRRSAYLSCAPRGRPRLSAGLARGRHFPEFPCVTRISEKRVLASVQTSLESRAYLLNALLMLVNREGWIERF